MTHSTTAVMKNKALPRVSPPSNAPKAKYKRPVVDIMPPILAACKASQVAAIGKMSPTPIRSQNVNSIWSTAREISFSGGEDAGSKEEIMTIIECNMRHTSVKSDIDTMGSFGRLPEVRYQCPQSIAMKAPPSTREPNIKFR